MRSVGWTSGNDEPEERTCQAYVTLQMSYYNQVDISYGQRTALQIQLSMRKMWHATKQITLLTTDPPLLVDLSAFVVTQDPSAEPTAS